MKKIRLISAVVIYIAYIISVNVITRYETPVMSTDTAISETTVYSEEQPEITTTYMTVTSKTETSPYENRPAFLCDDEESFPEGFYDDLTEIIERYPHFKEYDISVVYSDIETGFTVMINPDKHYYSASVIKAPYMLYIYELAEKGLTDISQTVVYKEEYKKGGTGVIRDMEPETEFSIEELIGYSLERSDNTAFFMLKNIYPEDDYRRYMWSIGIRHNEDLNNQICCESAMITAKEIYRFIGEKNAYSENLLRHMTSTLHPMIYAGENSVIARKYGWYLGYFHDMAIIYDERPYILAVMTDFKTLEIGETEYQLYKDISALFYNYSDRLYSEETDKTINIYTTD